MAELTENLLLLKDAPGVGNTIVWRLLKEFGSADGVFGASAEALTRVRGVTLEKAAGILEAGRRDPRPELEKAAEAGINVIPYDDPSYPKPLLHSFDPPVILYVRGALADEDQVAVGIVGTRQATPYGRERALELSAALARGGYTVVSGLARGIDTFAHIGALNAGGRTAGVLGCGFSHMYPEENRDLALEMSRNGVVISEFSMDTRPSRETFPARNRIIAGLSLGLLVIEAPLRSGSLITARLANENGRVVFAVPGRVGDPGSEGCNKLIRDGAVMVTGPDDVFNELNPSLPPPEIPARRAAPPLSRREKTAPASGSFSGPENKSGRPPPPGREKAGAAANNETKAKESRPAATDTDAGASVSAPRPKISPEQRTLLEAMTGDWQNIDDLSAAANLPAGKAAALLGLLRLQRLVEQGPGQSYRLRRAVK